MPPLVNINLFIYIFISSLFPCYDFFFISPEILSFLLWIFFSLPVKQGKDSSIHRHSSLSSSLGQFTFSYSDPTAFFHLRPAASLPTFSCCLGRKEPPALCLLFPLVRSVKTTISGLSSTPQTPANSLSLSTLKIFSSLFVQEPIQSSTISACYLLFGQQQSWTLLAWKKTMTSSEQVWLPSRFPPLLGSSGLSNKEHTKPFPFRQLTK